ncbi:MAG: OmpH family outer membrane protein [Candidatus Kapaibacterium sp.]
MKTLLSAKILLFVVVFVGMGSFANAQRVGFINSETIRTKYPDAQAADQRIQTMVDEWKRELAAIQSRIDALEFEIKKNRLIWSDEEREQKQRTLEDLKSQKMTYARSKFEPGGEYEATVKMIMAPIEAKIYATVQEVAADEGFDIVLDQSVQPMPYVNFKYDLTVKVLRNLGVDVQKLEAELQDKIEADPRNKRRESRNPRSRSRARRIGPDGDNDKPREEREIERNPGDPMAPENDPNLPDDERKRLEKLKKEENKVSPFKK